MDTNALQYFMEICSGITYSEVAFENNISTSTVSKSIQKLEQELDVKLFERVHRTVVLTDAGNCLYGHLKKMQPEYETLISDLRQYTNTLCINYGVIRTVNINIDRKMQEFKRLNPDLKINSRSFDTQQEALNRLKARSIDFLIIHQPLQRDLDEFEMRPFYNDKIVAVIPPLNPLTKEDEMTTDMLKNETFLVNGRTYDLLQELGAYFKFVPRYERSNVTYDTMLKNLPQGSKPTVCYLNDIEPEFLNHLVIRPIQDIPERPYVIAVFRMQKLNRQCRKLIRFLTDSDIGRQ